MTTRSLRARRLATAMAMILGAALLADCGGSSPAAPTAALTPAGPPASVAASIGPADTSSTGATDACAVVTTDAVSKATGFPIASTSGAAGTCYFQNADKGKYLAVQVFGNQAAMATILQIEPAGVHIAGLGDDAFWIPTSGILFARKGDHGVELLDPDLGTDASHTATRDALVALAQAALPNI